MTADQLRAAGIDLTGVSASRIGLTNLGAEVPLYVAGPGSFGPSSFLEFIGRQATSGFGKQNTYVLDVGRTRPARVVLDAQRLPRPPGMGVHDAGVELGRRREYAFASPTGDPWYDTRMVAATTPKEWSFSFDAEDLAAPTAPAEMWLQLFGGVSFPADPDHHVEVSVNGHDAGDLRFDGLTAFRAVLRLPPGVLRERGNTLVLRLPADLGTPADIVHLQSFGIRYERLLHASGDSVNFSGSAARFDVPGFTSPRVVVYRISEASVARLERVRIRRARDGSYSAALPGTPRGAEYLAVGEAALRVPSVERPRRTGHLLEGRAQYLVVAHREFLGGLAALQEARSAQGLTVKVVDVDDVYARYTHGLVDPRGLRAYAAEAAAKLGTEYLLLVGGDTYDYEGNLVTQSRSFIPSLYLPTSEVVRFAPADPALADFDSDGVPDVAIGRMPVRSDEELRTVVAKTLSYERDRGPRRALLVADRNDARANLAYSLASEAVAHHLGEGWAVSRFYLGEMAGPSAKSMLLSAINHGFALTTYIGHSGPSSWSSESVLTVRDVASLTNADRLTVVIQWGCWNTYYVAPDQVGLGVALLLSSSGGAAATLGATALSEDLSQNLLARRLAAELGKPGARLGDAVLNAKRALAREKPGLVDVQYGWTLLGDPALVVGP